MKDKYIKNFVLSTLNTVTGLLVPLITFPYVSRVLGPEKIGIVNFVQAYGYYFIHIASFGLNSYALREVSKIRDDKEKVKQLSNELYNINFFFSVISGLLYLLGVLIVGKFRADANVFCIYSVVIFTNFLSLEWFLQSFDDYFFSTVRSCIIRIISLVLIFILVSNKNDYIIYISITTISEMGARLSNLIYARKKYLDLRLGIHYFNLNNHIKALFTLFIFRLVNGISANLDRLMIGFYMAYEYVGVYSAGVRIILLLTPIIETIGIVLFPKINISAGKSKDEYINNLKLNYNSILILSIPMLVGMILISPRLINLFAGEGYTGAIPVSRIMAACILLGPLGDMIGSKILLVHKRDNDLLLTSIMVAVSNIVFNIILIPIWGINGAAIASLISYFVSDFVRYIFACRIIKFNLITKEGIKYLLFTVPFILLYLAFRIKIDTDTLWMFVFVFVCCILYFLELLLFKDELMLKVLGKVFVKFDKKKQQTEQL